MSNKLIVFPSKLTKIIKFLYKYQVIFITKHPIKVSFTIDEALRLVKLPPINNNTHIRLLKESIDKTDLTSKELHLVELCENYYNGYYPKYVLKEQLINNVSHIPKIIQFFLK